MGGRVFRVKEFAWVPLFLFIISAAAATAAEVVAQFPAETFFLYRTIGAALGSTVAVIFKLRKGTVRAGLLMFLVGFITGFVAARWIMDLFEWPNVADYWLIASGIGGLLGYIVLQLVYSKKMEVAMERRAGISND